LNGMQKIDRSGQRFGHITVLSLATPRRQPSGKALRLWRCRCDCGTELEATADNLQQRPDPSCGCRKRVKISARIRRHGDGAPGKVRLYTIWNGMLRRCRAPKCKAYKNYGGRGITVDPCWLDYVAFKAWALNSGYADNLTIDRIDSNGNYEPDNCRWATMLEQRHNRRSTEIAI